jgi:hypothetical protein
MRWHANVVGIGEGEGGWLVPRTVATLSADQERRVPYINLREFKTLYSNNLLMIHIGDAHGKD